jgi:hypothetical protein
LESRNASGIALRCPSPCLLIAQKIFFGLSQIDIFFLFESVPLHKRASALQFLSLFPPEMRISPAFCDDRTTIITRPLWTVGAKFVLVFINSGHWPCGCFPILRQKFSDPTVVDYRVCSRLSLHCSPSYRIGGATRNDPPTNLDPTPQANRTDCITQSITLCCSQ